MKNLCLVCTSSILSELIPEWQVITDEISILQPVIILPAPQNNCAFLLNFTTLPHPNPTKKKFPIKSCYFPKHFLSTCPNYCSCSFCSGKVYFCSHATSTVLFGLTPSKVSSVILLWKLALDQKASPM